LINWLERHFDFERHGANWTDEIIAGLTTFITMAYILFVNPNILGEAGMPKAQFSWQLPLELVFPR